VRRLAVTLSLAALAACASVPVAPPAAAPAARDYAPLPVGASWTYAMNFQGQTGERTVRIVEERDGYAIDSERGELRHTAEGLRDRSRFLLRNPLEAGRTWRSVLSASAVERYRIVSVGERCESQAGAFPDCLVVEASIRRDAEVTLHSRFVWARGVGLVKIETEVELAGKGRVPQTRQSLLRYRLTPEPASERPADDGPDAWRR
jgi:hypothetical protein